MICDKFREFIVCKLQHKFYRLIFASTEVSIAFRNIWNFIDLILF